LKLNDEINFFNFKFEEKYISKKVKYQPTNQIIKESENLIIDNNDDFVVLNKECGISVQGGTKSKKISWIFLQKVKFLKIQSLIQFID
jgi:23S rRNA pseudouridine955/2504/2580 synthase